VGARLQLWLLQVEVVVRHRRQAGVGGY